MALELAREIAIEAALELARETAKDIAIEIGCDQAGARGRSGKHGLTTNEDG